MAETPGGSSPNARFLSDATPGGRRGRSRYGGALGVSVASHVASFVVILGLVTRLPPDAASKPSSTDMPSVVWLVSRGGGNAGGGGGDGSSQPPRRMEAPGAEAATVPVRPTFTAASEPRATPPTDEALQIPAVPTVSGVEQVVGVVSDLSKLPSDSLGPGTRGAGGPGRGGNGPDSGPGVGPRDGCCGEVFTTGIDIVGPQLIREIKPGYTAEAMRAKVQGLVILEAVVLPDGSVGTVHILKSLDPVFGLDNEAVKTVRLWRFKPGTKSGKPVPIRVQIDLAFMLR